MAGVARSAFSPEQERVPLGIGGKISEYSDTRCGLASISLACPSLLLMAYFR
jgi:hypothetical protein